MLHLKLPTDPRWVNLAAMQLEDILTDHAYCEQKAALSGISLISQYPEKDMIVNELSPLVTEEWGHFRMVLRELRKRNLTLGRQRKDEYVNQLLKHQRTGDRDRGRLMDKLLTNALIEARSCERFKLLSEQLEDAELRHFYRGFMESEAGHYTLFMNIAYNYFDETEVDARWQFFLEEEVIILNNLVLRGDRVH